MGYFLRFRPSQNFFFPKSCYILILGAMGHIAPLYRRSWCYSISILVTRSHLHNKTFQTLHSMRNGLSLTVVRFKFFHPLSSALKSNICCRKSGSTICAVLVPKPISLLKNPSLTLPRYLFGIPFLDLLCWFLDMGCFSLFLWKNGEKYFRWKF